MKKNFFLTLVGFMFFSTLLSGAQIYNNDSNSTTVFLDINLSLGLSSPAYNIDGKLDWFEDNYHNSDITLSSTQQINEKLSVFGTIQWLVDPFKKNTFNIDKIDTEQVFVGIEHNIYGKFIFGKQSAPFSRIAGYTDLFESSTFYDANGSLGDNENGNFHGAYIANKSFKYENTIGRLTFAGLYQGSGTSKYDENLERKYNIGFGMSIQLATGINAGVATSFAKIDHLTYDHLNLDRFATVAGFHVKEELIEGGFTVSYNTNLYDSYVSESNTIGQESYLGVNLINKLLVYTGNNISYSVYENPTVENVIQYNYIVFGSKLFLSESANILVEYQHDLRKTSAINLASTNYNMNNLLVALEYSF